LHKPSDTQDGRQTLRDLTRCGDGCGHRWSSVC